MKKILTYRTSCKFRVTYELEFLVPLKINSNSSCVKKKKKVRQYYSSLRKLSNLSWICKFNTFGRTQNWGITLR